MHGLGFAGALREIGLPGHDLWTALLTFNVGVEAGQIFVVVVAYAAWRLLARMPHASLARAPALYVIGSVAAFWSIDRIAAMLGA